MYTEILLNKMRALTEELRLCENRIRREQLRVMEVRASIRVLEGGAMYEVSSKLLKQIQGMERDIQKVRMLRTALSKIISLYENCEEKIVSLDDGRKNLSQNQFGSLEIKPYAEILKILNLRIKTQPLKGGKE